MSDTNPWLIKKKEEIDYLIMLSGKKELVVKILSSCQRMEL